MRNAVSDFYFPNKINLYLLLLFNFIRWPIYNLLVWDFHWIVQKIDLF